MKYNQRDVLLKEEEAYKNEIYPTKKPKSSKEIKQQLNNSFRSAYSNISKNNFSTSNFFESNIKRIESNKKANNNFNNYNLNENNEKYLDIIPDINYNNEIINNNNEIKIKSSNIELNYCVGIISKIKYSFCFHSKEKFFIYISKNTIILEDFSVEKKENKKY